MKAILSGVVGNLSQKSLKLTLNKQNHKFFGFFSPSIGTKSLIVENILGRSKRAAQKLNSVRLSLKRFEGDKSSGLTAPSAIESTSER